ncbi:hypothetical protein P6144_15410 [Sphingomonas sp. HITSZ_GF]|nr:hypothetical protein [Sphingomonas sp. HITSZ_GF]
MKGISQALMIALVSVPLAGPRSPMRPIRIASSDLKCIRDNLSAYLAQPRQAVILIPGTCPNPRPPVSDYTRPRAQSGVTIPRNDTSGIIVLSKPQLECLTRYYASLPPATRNQPFIEWNTDSCQFG